MTRLKVISVVMSLFLILSLAACTTKQIEYVKPPSIPANLLNDCLPPYPPKPFTFGKSIIYNEQLLNVIEQCNKDKAAIREINQ